MKDYLTSPGKLFRTPKAGYWLHRAKYLRHLLATPSVPGIAEMKDIHKGSRAFLVGNGPSLNKIDLTRLNGEITFGVNGIFLMENFMPKYWLTISENYVEGKEDLIQSSLRAERCFIPSSMTSVKLDLPSEYFLYEKIPNLAPNKQPALVPSYFSFRPDKVVQGGGTVLFACMQLAFFMGIREIILVGVDHDYGQPGEGSKEVKTGYQFVNTGTSHFREDYRPEGEVFHLNYAHLERAYRVGLETFQKHGGSIVNATPGTKLDIYPKVEFESLFQ